MSQKLFQDFPSISAKEWKQKIQMDLKGADYNDNLVHSYADGIDTKPFYHSDDMQQHCKTKHPKTWAICEKIYLASETAAAKHIQHVLARGAESLWLTVPSKTTDLKKVLENIPLEETPIFLNFEFLDEAYLNELGKFLQGKAHHIQFGIDPIGQLTQSGNWFDNQTNDLACVARFLEANPTEQALLSIDARIYQNAGASITQQIAYAIAHAHEYLHVFTPQSKLNKLTFTMAIGGNYFFEIAKLRALRTVYATIAKAYQLPEEINIITQPSRRNKTLYDYNVNLLRTTTENMSAILGGANQVCPMAYDEIFHKQNEFGNRIARNQLLILKEESYFDRKTNFAEGSYYLETLTEQFSEKALQIFKDIEKGRGLLQQLKEGTIQRKIKESADKEEAMFDQAETPLVGTNKYINPEDRMKNDLELYPFVKQKPRKTLISPLIAKRLAEKVEQQRLENEQ